MKGSQNTKITYIALGTSTAAPASTDTRLGAEVFRKKVTSYTNGSSTGEILINVYLAPGDAVGVDIEEIGFFGGNASTLRDSGVLLARGLYNHNPKTAIESIQFQLDMVI